MFEKGGGAATTLKFKLWTFRILTYLHRMRPCMCPFLVVPCDDRLRMMSSFVGI